MATIKCRKCRNILLQTETRNITDAHGIQMNFGQTATKYENCNCSSVEELKELFLQEDSLPDWIQNEITFSQWTKGKLKCQNCDARVGSFDFISGNRCNCSEYVLPPVHFVKSKVDYPINRNNPL